MRVQARMYMEWAHIRRPAVGIWTGRTGPGQVLLVLRVVSVVRVTASKISDWTHINERMGITSRKLRRSAGRLQTTCRTLTYFRVYTHVIWTKQTKT